MNNLKTLLKYNFLGFLNKFKGKEKKKSTTSAFIIVCILAIGILALYTLQAKAMFDGLGKVGLANVCMFHSYTTSLTVLVILGVMRTSGKKKHSDEDLLLSLPIKKIDIVIFKQVGKYLLDFALTFLLLMPYAVLYLIYEGFNLGILLVSILFVFVLPLFSVGITNICNFIISKLFNKSRYGDLLKSMSSVLIYLLVFALMLIKTSSYGTVNPENIASFFADRPITNFVLNGVIYQKVLNIIVTTFTCVFVFTLGVVLYSKTLGKNFVGYNSKNKEVKVKIEKSPLKSLIKKELSFYANCTAYVSNTIIGPLMILILSILLSTMGFEKFSQSFGLMLSKETLIGLMILIYNFMISTTIISCSSLSLEGKNFWILKSAPLKTKYVLLSKSFVQILMTVPAILIGDVVISLSFGLSFLDFVMLGLIPSIFAVSYSFLGLFINIMLPKFDFQEETQVIKQSLASLISILSGILLGIIPLGIYLLFDLSLFTVILISLALYVLVLIASICLLFIKGKKAYEKL